LSSERVKESVGVAELPSGTVTFLFTDLEGSTRLWEQHRDAMQAALARHDEILREAVETNKGIIVKSTGDGIHAVFGSAHDALGASVAAQHGLDSEMWPTPRPLRVRMGVHTGEAEHRDGDYYGTATNRAARLMSVAHGGQILVSLSTEELLSDNLPDGVSLVDLGEHRLRDLSRPDRIFQVSAAGLAGEFPPIRSLDAYPGNLPVQLSSFVGRHDELVAVGKVLRESRLVTITGTGGVGKTRIAVQLAAEVLQRFPDGAWLCELAAAGDPESMLEAVASTLGAIPRAGMSLTASIAEFLRTRVLLLVLDNCEHLLDATARLADAILRDAPGVRIVATSREGLAVEGERVVPLRSLPVPDPAFAELEQVAASEAVRLFGERAEAARPGFSLEPGNATAVADICRRLDGVPLAIELAAARIAAMSPAEVAERLDERFRLLTGGRRTAVERHHTLRSTVDWSYSLLSPAEQHIFDRLGVFAGGFGTSAAEAVASGDGIEAWDVVDALSSLVAKSMINVDELADGTTRHELLETLRAYARERLDEAGVADEYRRRHAEHYAEFAERAGRGLIGPDEFAWRRRFRADLANLRAAVTWALDTAGESESAVRIIAGLASESITDHTAGVGAWADKARTAAAQSTPGRHSAVLAAAAWYAWYLGDFETAYTVALDAVRADPVADCAVPSFAYVVLTAAAGFLRRQEQTINALNDAARNPAFINDRFGRIQLLATAAVGAAWRNDYPEARANATEAVKLARELDNPTALAIALGVFGLSSVRDDPDAAIQALEESIALTRIGAGDVIFATSLALVAPLRAHAGDLPGALAAAREAFAYAHDTDDLTAIAATLACLVELVYRSGYTESAAVLAGILDSDAFRPLLYPNDPHLLNRKRILEAARAQLGDEAYEGALARGAAMSYDAGLAYALAELNRSSNTAG
jgi:predicted ATPase/class 3 adenylate cyclase